MVNLVDYDDEIPDGLSIGPDGRSHPTWNAHVVPTSRLSCYRPGVQQQPEVVREMFTCEEDNILVGADGEQMEVRLLAAVANVSKYREVFAKGGDIHAYTTEKLLGIRLDDVIEQYDRVFADIVYGKRRLLAHEVPKELKATWEKVLSGKIDQAQGVRDAAKAYFKRMRQIGKICCHSKSYGALDERTYSIVRWNPRVDAEIRNNISRRFIDTACANWRTEFHEIPTYQEACFQFWQQHGYVETPFHHRKRFFANGHKDRNAMANHPIQSAAAEIVNEAMIELYRLFGFDHVAKTGIVIQNHDAIYLEVRKSDAERVAKALEKSMHRTFNGIEIFAKAKIGKSWAEVS